MRLGLVLAAGAGVALAATAALRSVAAAEAKPDFTLFKERIEPVLQTVCAQCHAGQGKGQFKLVAHAPGSAFPEADHRKNYETVLKLLVPGEPEKSKFLQKPLANSGDGVPHGGGDRIFQGTAAYRAWTDFINGVRPARPAGPAGTKPAGVAGVEPDFGLFVARVEPTLLSVCAQCHAGQGKGQFRLVTHLPGSPFPLADHRENYETVLRLLTPGKPLDSKFLLKPLAERDGGVKHEGGDRIFRGDANHLAWTDFINGAKGPPPPEDVPEEVALPSVLDQGLLLQAEGMVATGDAAPADEDGAQGKVVAPGASGGRLTARFRVSRTADYALTLRGTRAPRGFRVRVDGSEPIEVDPPKDALSDTSPRLPLDGGLPLEARLGRLSVRSEGGALRMDGRQGTARFLSPADLPHTRVEARVSIPDVDEPGRDDAWLLFDCIDQENGKFLGLSDGGRKVVMGVLEGGRPRIVKSAPGPEGSAQRPEGTEGRRLGIDLLDGVAVGRLDGKPVLAVNFDRNLGAARFGFLTHGIATVEELVAWRGTEEVHRMRLTEGGVFHLLRGNHELEIELLPNGAALDSTTVRDVSR